MKGEYISIETLEIMSEIEKENEKLQKENAELKQKLELITENIKELLNKIDDLQKDK